MVVSVEFFGIPRCRAGVASTTVSIGAPLGAPLDGPMTLAVLLNHLSRRFPEFGEQCVDNGRLKPGYIVNFNGREFVVQPETVIPSNASVLVMSSDAGG